MSTISVKIKYNIYFIEINIFSLLKPTFQKKVFKKNLKFVSDWLNSNNANFDYKWRIYLLGTQAQ